MLGRAALIVCSVAVLGAQTAPPPVGSPQAPLQSYSDEVVVPVTVTNFEGHFVTNLKQDDFRVFEEGVEQKITYFNAEHNQPVVVGFLLDTSSTTRVHWKRFQEAALDLVDTLLPGDPKYSGYLINYGNDAVLEANTSMDPEKMMDRIRKSKPGGGAALFDAIYMACTSRDLVKGEPLEPRRVIVIIGDGHDTASKKAKREVLELAQRNQFTIYGISTMAFGFSAEGDATLRELADATGGRVEYPLNNLYKDVSGYLSNPSDEGNYAYKVGTGAYESAISTGVFNSIKAVVGEITTQYVIRYKPSNTDSNALVHRIRVVVNLPAVTIRHREFYYPTPP